MPLALVCCLPLCVLVGAPQEAREKEGSSPRGGELATGRVWVPLPLGMQTGRRHQRKAQLLRPQLVCVCAWRRGPPGIGQGCGVRVSCSQPGRVCRAGGTGLEPRRAWQDGHSTGLSSSLQFGCPSQGPVGRPLRDQRAGTPRPGGGPRGLGSDGRAQGPPGLTGLRELCMQ